MTDAYSVAEKMRLSDPTTRSGMTIDPYYQRQNCRPMSLVSGGIRFMWIFAEVPRGWASASYDSGVVENGDFLRFRWLLFRKLWRQGQRYYDMRSVVGFLNFLMITKCMALNDLELLFRVKFCFRVGLAG